jgi:hypothetical protein
VTRVDRRRLELAAGAPKSGAKPGTWAVNKAMRSAERELARQGEIAYRQTVGRHQPQDLRFSSSSGPAPGPTLPNWRCCV